MLVAIKDKFDVENAERIVQAGFPANKEFIVDLIFWSCFPNDPVCSVVYSYVDSLSDEVLASAMAEFVQYHSLNGQDGLVEIAFDCFIATRGPEFTKLMCKLDADGLIKRILSELKDDFV